MARLIASLPVVWAGMLAVLLLGPALGHGNALTYDMVWVPDLALNRDALGLGSGLPRAVPSDAVVAVLDEIAPGELLEKLVLLSALVGAGVGASALVAARSLAARLAVVSLTVWSPYVAERLWLGHWPMLLAYAAVPWLALAGRRIAEGGRWPRWLLLVLLVGSLSASAGIVSGLTLVVTGWRGSRVRLAVAVIAANLPWVVAGAAHATAAQAATGFGVFALRGDALPAPLAALTLGGVWNTSVMPHSRTTWLAWAALAFVVVLAGVGLRRWRRDTERQERIAHAALWAAGLAVAVAGWAIPGALDRAAAYVPGLALLRDGSRLLPLCLPLLIGLVAAGVDAIRCRLPGTAPRLAGAVVVVLLPLTVLPDAGWGLAGHVGSAIYPAEWSAADSKMTKDGDVLVLPWSAYRAPTWNAGRPVLDPLPRMLTRSTVVDGDLIVGTTTVPGEDPRATAAASALAEPGPEQRSRALRRLGIAYVVIDRTAGTAPEIAGETVHDGAGLTVLHLVGRVTGSDRFRPAPLVRAVVVAAWLAYLLIWLAGLLRIPMGAATVRAEGEGGHIR